MTGDTIQIDNMVSIPAGSLTADSGWTCSALQTPSVNYGLQMPANAISLSWTVNSAHGTNCHDDDFVSYTIASNGVPVSGWQFHLNAPYSMTQGNFTTSGSERMGSVSVKPGPMPSPSPTPAPPCVTAFPLPSTTDPNYNNVVHINGLISADANLKSIMAFVSQAGKLPTLAFGPAKGAAARLDYGTNTLTWDISVMPSALASGQAESQILYHELEHSVDLVRGTNGTAQINFGSAKPTAIFNGVTYTFELDDEGKAAFEHMLVHNNLVNKYGMDKTGAILSLLYHLRLLPNKTSVVYSDIDPKFFTMVGTVVSGPEAYPPTTYSCSAGSHSKTRRVQSMVDVPVPNLPSFVFTNVYSVTL